MIPPPDPLHRYQTSIVHQQALEGEDGVEVTRGRGVKRVLDAHFLPELLFPVPAVHRRGCEGVESQWYAPL